MSTSTTLPRNRGSSSRHHPPVEVREREPERSAGVRGGDVGGRLRCGRPVLRTAIQCVCVRSPAWKMPRKVSPSRRARQQVDERAVEVREREAVGLHPPGEVAIVSAVRNDRAFESSGPVAELEDPRARPPVAEERSVPPAQQRGGTALRRPGAACWPGTGSRAGRGSRRSGTARAGSRPRRRAWMAAAKSAMLEREAVGPDPHLRERGAAVAVAKAATPGVPFGAASTSAKRSGPPARSSAAFQPPAGVCGRGRSDAVSMSGEQDSEPSRDRINRIRSSPTCAGIESAAAVPLARRHRRRDRVAAPRRRTGIDAAIGTERIAGPVEVQPVATVPRRHEGHEPARGIGALAVGPVAEIDLQLALVARGAAAFVAR